MNQDGNDWVACCAPLDLYTQSDSKDSAMVLLHEAVSLWFESCMERNVWPAALEEVGFKPFRAGDKTLENTDVFNLKVEKNSETSARQEIEISIPAYIAAAMTPSTHGGTLIGKN